MRLYEKVTITMHFGDFNISSKKIKKWKATYYVEVNFSKLTGIYKPAVELSCVL